MIASACISVDRADSTVALELPQLVIGMNKSQVLAIGAPDRINQVPPSIEQWIYAKMERCLYFSEDGLLVGIEAAV